MKAVAVVALASIAACGSGDARTQGSASAPVVLDPAALPLDYSWAQATAWLEKNDYPVAQSNGDCAPKCTSYEVEGTRLQGTKLAEEELTFEFTKAGDESPPICLRYAPGFHGDAWQQRVEQLFGAPMVATGALDATNPACHAVDAEHLACNFVMTARGGRPVPVEIDVEPRSLRKVWQLRFGPCAEAKR